MPKSKRSPALFELINNTRSNGKSSKLAIPKWFKPAASGPQSEEAPSTEPDEPAAIIAPPPVPPPAPRIVAGPRPAGPPPASPPPASPPPPSHSEAMSSLSRAVKIHGSRLELSLNPSNIAIAAGVLVLVVLGSYWIGHGFGSKFKNGQGLQVAGAPANDEVSQALDQPAGPTNAEPSRTAALMSNRAPAEHVPAPAAGPAAAPSPETPAASRGPNHIVIENFKLEHLKSAEHVRDWLASKYGLRTELHRAGESIWLVTLDGFDLNKPGDKEALANRVEEIKSMGGACGRELAKNNLPIYLLKSPSPRRFD